MTIKERVAEMVHRLAVQLAEEKTEDHPQTQLASAMLENGQEIQTSAEAFAEGADVFVVNDEGENIPLPDGDYTLEDGTAFAVAEGVITAMGGAETEAGSEEEKELSKEAPAEATALSREDVQAMIDAAVKSATTQLSEQFAAELAAKSEQIQKLSEQPAAKLSRQEPRQTFSRQELAAMSLKERVRALSN